MTNLLSEYHTEAKRFREIQVQGKITQMVGQMIEAYNPGCAIGNLCSIVDPVDSTSFLAEVVGFKEDKMLLTALENVQGINPKCRVIPQHLPPQICVGEELLGRVFDPLYRPLDRAGDVIANSSVPIYRDPPNPMERERITSALDVGIRAINSCLTCGKGQRVGILAGSGVGKSVLIGMMARYTSADVNVIALIGERGREVRDFIERDLGKEGMKKTIVVVATSDQPPLLRMRGAYVATAISEYFREQGKDVLLVMDSLTRFAMAQREIGLAAGEPPTTKGYPPSVFASLPGLLERAGTDNHGGSITGFYTVLAEGDDSNDPIVDSVRAIVDGHIVLSRDIAAKGHYPAIDISTSASRVMSDVVSSTHQKLALALRGSLASYREAEDLINIGAYVSGSNPEIDDAVAKRPQIQKFLQQGIDEKTSYAESVAGLQHIFN